MTNTTLTYNVTNEDIQYDRLLKGVKEHFATCAKEPLFKTDAKGLYDIFLSKIPEESRQTYECSTCRQFVEQFGGLVNISEDGNTIPAVWPEEVPGFYKEAVKAVCRAVKKAKVTGVFYTEEATLGMEEKGGFNHLALKVPEEAIFSDSLLTADQAAAEKAENRRMLAENIHYYKEDVMKKAVNLLQSGELNRTEKVQERAEWLLMVKQEVSKLDPYHANNRLWYYAATAPTAFCHISGKTLGELLESIRLGLSMATIKARFNHKVDALNYQRPKSAPSEKQVEQAEKIVEKLGIEKSLYRRFARLDDIQKIWQPKEQKDCTKRGGVFANIVTKEDSKNNKHDTFIPTKTMTWVKFEKEVLPKAQKIEFLIDELKRENFAALVTSADESAPPILQWDQEDNRNPVSWYVYHNGSTASRWGLTSGYCEVSAVAYQPSMWNGEYSHMGKGVFFILEDAKDNGYRGCGSALFPEILQGKFHQIRSTIEAFSKATDLTGYEEASACGLLLSGGNAWNKKFRVTTNMGTTIYCLDRWD